MTTTIHLHPQPGDFKARHGGPGKYHPAYATVEMESRGVDTVIFLDSAAKCDALIKAAVEAKRLLLGDDVPPALIQDLADAEASLANPYGGQAKHGEFTAKSAAAVAEDVEPQEPAGHLPQHKGGRPECTLCDEPGHHLHAISRPGPGNAA